MSKNTQTKKESRARLREVSKFNKGKYKEYKKMNWRRHVSSQEYNTTMRDPGNLIEIDNLHTYFYTDIGTVKAVNGVSYDIPKGKTIGVVGESGCGKSVTSLSIMRLVQGPTGQIVNGRIRYNRGEQAIDLTKISKRTMQDIRGNEIGMIFQEPMTSLNPVFKIGKQIDETIKLHNSNLKNSEIKKRSIEMLELVGIARAEGIYHAYPHELSGGMRQRVMIAMSLSCNPKLIIADEPTTALDVTIQAQILDLLRELKDKVDASILLITHDLGVVAEMADYVVVMYAGRIVEIGTAEDIYLRPKHPYTVGLLNSKPVVNKSGKRLYTIPGTVPNPIAMPNHCFFKDRCSKATDRCEGCYPDFVDIEGKHKTACWLYAKEEQK